MADSDPTSGSAALTFELGRGSNKPRGRCHDGRFAGGAPFVAPHLGTTSSPWAAEPVQRVLRNH